MSLGKRKWELEGPLWSGSFAHRLVVTGAVPICPEGRCLGRRGHGCQGGGGSEQQRLGQACPLRCFDVLLSSRDRLSLEATSHTT